MGAQGIVGAGRHELGPFGIALAHGGGRPPGRPFDLLHDAGPASAREVLAQGHRGGLEPIDPRIRGPEMHAAAVDIAQDRAAVPATVPPVAMAEGE